MIYIRIVSEFFPLFWHEAKFGLTYVKNSHPRFSSAIKNDKDEGLLYTDSTTPYQDMLRKNIEKCKNNIKEGKLIANGGKYGIRLNLVDYTGQS